MEARQLADRVTELRYKDPHGAIDFGHQALKLLNRFPDDEAKIRTLNEMGYAYMMIGDYDEALEYAGRGRDLSTATGNRKGLSRALNNLAAAHQYLGDLKEAIALYIESLHLSEALHDQRASAGTLHNIATAYLHTGQYDSAIRFLKQSLVITRAMDDKQSIAYSTDDLGVAYLNKGQPKAALTQFLEARDLLGALGDQQGQVANLFNMASAYHELGDLEQSLLQLEKGLKLAKAYQLQGGDLVDLLVLKARVLNSIGRYSDALGAATRARDIALEGGQKGPLRDAYEAMAQVLEALHQPARALQAYKQFKAANDDLINSESSKTLAHLQTTFGLERKQQEIAGLKQQNRIQALEAEQARQQRMVWFTALVGLFLLTFFIYNRRVQARRLAEEQQLNQHLRSLDAVKDQVMANTSHEMRTPLNGIIGLADCLLEEMGGDATPDTRRSLGMIVASGKRMATLVNDILDFSKVRNATLELSLQPLNLREVIEEVVTLSEPMAAQKDLEIVCDIAADVTAVMADENRLRQILHNLLGNAIKFTESGRVTVAATREIDQACLCVSDTGVGIAAADQERIFRSFEQLDGSIQRQFGGTGLGLAVTRELVRLHGSDVGVESTPGEGSSFSFHLPLASELAATDVAAPVPLAEAAFPERGRPATLGSVHPIAPPQEEPEATLQIPEGEFRILVVDDEPVNLEVMVRQLDIGGFELLQASNGEQALDCLEQFAVDLVLLDIMMPKMSGYTVLKKIRAKYPLDQLPVITVTAKNQVADLVHSFAVGANDFVSKPVTRDELTARVITHLNLHQLKRIRNAS